LGDEAGVMGEVKIATSDGLLEFVGRLAPFSVDPPLVQGAQHLAVVMSDSDFSGWR